MNQPDKHEKNTNRLPDGKFKKGVSGNPSGRTGKGRTELRQKLEKDADKVLDVVMNLALGGDIQACKLILDRTIPALKPRAAAVDIPTPTDHSPGGLAEALIRATMAGSIDPDTAAVLLGAVANLARVKEAAPATQTRAMTLAEFYSGPDGLDDFRKVARELIDEV